RVAPASPDRPGARRGAPPARRDRARGGHRGNGAAMSAAPAEILKTYACEDCGATITQLFGKCEHCWQKRGAESRRKERVERTRETVPQRYRWARFDAPELGARVASAQAIETA